MAPENKPQPFGKSADFYGKLNKTNLERKYMEEFNIEEWEKQEDNRHIQWLSEHCIKGCTNEKMSIEEATFFYNDFVKEQMLYHNPEDSETIHTIIETYNYLNKWK